MEEIAKLLDEPAKQLIRLHKVCWLSLETVVTRFLDMNDTLFLYFKRQRERDSEDDAAVKIFMYSKKSTNLLHLHFLTYILPELNKLTRESQRTENSFSVSKSNECLQNDWRYVLE